MCSVWISVTHNLDWQGNWKYRWTFNLGPSWFTAWKKKNWIHSFEEFECKMKKVNPVPKYDK